ncbi:4Fe-4S binding protein [Terrisporobacter petrolearius]|uniref:4Fe-4S binding protein n=1 Tax=Terrisporobacter petrolearius TaxID=1460447 RepID=UPI001D165BA1|nr:4Fe-4S binding protein [Terrisporobacter petrolearius]MCC3862773.1 4Fe-4S binding protein [Terrisporobacter petrolearius]
MNKNKKKKTFKDYMWIISVTYLTLGFFNILFGWLGVLCFLIPLIISLSGHGKTYCNTYCGRGQMLDLMGNKLKLSQNRDIPKFLRSKWFRYGFLTFFMTMFVVMLFNTYLVFNGTNALKEVVKLIWTFKVPWAWTNTSMVTPWVAQFAFGFYSMMLTSTILGIITMLLYKPKSWCVYCPMGTMTQLISKAKYTNKSNTSYNSCSSCSSKVS